MSIIVWSTLAGAAGVMIFLFLLAQQSFQRRRLFRELQQRPVLSDAHMIEAFGRNILLPIITDVLQRLRDSAGTPNPIYPADRLISQFGIDDEDLEDLVSKFAHDYSIKLTKTAYLPGPDPTVYDMVHFCHNLLSGANPQPKTGASKSFLCLLLPALLLSGCASNSDLDCAGCDAWSFKFMAPVYLLAQAKSDADLTTSTVTALFQEAIPAAIKQGHDAVYLNVYHASGTFAGQATLYEGRTTVVWAPDATEFH